MTIKDNQFHKTVKSDGLRHAKLYGRIMPQTKVKAATPREVTLRALKLAVVEGTTWRYDHLVALALAAGATDDDIDQIASEAIQSLLTGAEQPMTARTLAHDWPVGHFGS